MEDTGIDAPRQPGSARREIHRASATLSLELDPVRGRRSETPEDDAVAARCLAASPVDGLALENNYDFFNMYKTLTGWEEGR